MSKVVLTGEKGMTLLEVIMSISILLILSVAATQMIRSSIDMRIAVSEETALNHRLAVAMQKITEDLQHSYIISTLRTEYNPGGRSTKTLFRVKRTSESYDLAITTMNQQPFTANSKKPDQTFVVYRVMEDKDDHNRTHLFRGQMPSIPEDLDDEQVPLQILAKDIKAVRIYPWKGDGWDKERWDTEKADWRNQMPHMVFVEIEALDQDFDERPDASDASKEPVVTKVNTVVYLPRSPEFKEHRESGTNIKYF